MKSYDYQHRKGIQHISWSDFGRLAARLAEGLAPYKPQVIVGIARAGLFPAAAMSTMLRLEMFPARVTRRKNDQVVYKSPVWKVPLSSDIRGQVVAVVDEIADTGETLAMVAEEARKKGAERVVTASLVSHSWATPKPDVIALVTDALVIFPWDRDVLIDGQWQPHPELAAALESLPDEEIDP